VDYSWINTSINSAGSEYPQILSISALPFELGLYQQNLDLMGNAKLPPAFVIHIRIAPCIDGNETSVPLTASMISRNDPDRDSRQLQIPISDIAVDKTKVLN
jgi:hypothetical protein